MNEAKRFISQHLAHAPSEKEYSDSCKNDEDTVFAAIHWRHGDYSAYGHLAERERVVNAAQAALAELACSTCKVFVMSNCGDEQECAAAYQALAKTRAWGWPSDGATTNHALMLT